MRVKGRPIKELICLKLKLYSILYDENTSKNKGKGVKRSTMKRMKHIDFMRCLKGSEKLVEGDDSALKDAMQECKFYNFIAREHKVTTNIITKIALCAYDNKRYHIDAYKSRPFRHYKNEIKK